MKLFTSKNTTTTKNIKNFQTLAIQKEQLKSFKGGNGESQFIEDEVIEW